LKDKIKFWLSLLVVVLSAVYGSGLIGEGTPASRIIVVALTVLAGAGYTAKKVKDRKKQEQSKQKGEK